MNSAETLYTTKDVARVRELLLEEQFGMDALTGLDIPPKQAVLDHCHKGMHVRAVLHRQSNAVLGKIENLWNRYLSWWYPGTLAQFLRQAADYIEYEHPKRFIHTGWLKKAKTEFNKLNAVQKTQVLNHWGTKSYKNDAERKLAFGRFLLTKQYPHDIIDLLLKQAKGST